MLLASVAVAVSLALPAVHSDARFNSASENPGDRFVADDPANYLRLLSAATDPAGPAGYATKRGSAPAAPAATGADATLAAALGGFRNERAVAVSRVFTLQAMAPLPAGASPLTVTASPAADPLTGRQPLTQVRIAELDGTGAATTATLPAGAKRRIDVVVGTQAFPANNRLYRPTITLTVRHPGYQGSFLNYVVPVTVWDGSGAGP